VAWVRERTIPTERSPLVGEVSANIADRGCHVVSMTDPYGRILGFLDWSRYFFFQVAPQLCSRGWVDPVPDPVLRKSGSVGNRTRTSESVAWYWPLDHRGRGGGMLLTPARIIFQEVSLMEAIIFYENKQVWITRLSFRTIALRVK
jgi:hypothetical protein